MIFGSLSRFSINKIKRKVGVGISYYFTIPYYKCQIRKSLIFDASIQSKQ